MGILIDKFKSNPVHQAIETTLKYIDDCKSNENLTDANRDSLDAYGQLLIYAKYVMENNITQVVPPQILTNLTNNINNLQNNNALNIETTYNLYTAITSDLAKIPVYNDKNVVKSGLGKIIKNFNNDKEKIQTEISNEIENFKQKQSDELEKWKEEKEEYEQQLGELKKQNKALNKELENLNTVLSKEQEKTTALITDLKENYDTKVASLKETFENSEKEREEKFTNFHAESKEKTDTLLKYMQDKQLDVERLWGIIGKAVVSGSSQNYANKAKNFAHTMMGLSLIIMSGAIIFLAYTFYEDVSSPNFNPMSLLYRIPFVFTLFLPAWYCANIASKQRNREFQLRDFEIKTAGLEPFMENMKMVKCNDCAGDDKPNKKDETKLELVRDIFQNDLNRKKVDDGNIIIPKDMVELLKSCLETWTKIKGKNE